MYRYEGIQSSKDKVDPSRPERCRWDYKIAPEIQDIQLYNGAHRRCVDEVAKAILASPVALQYEPMQLLNVPVKVEPGANFAWVI